MQRGIVGILLFAVAGGAGLAGVDLLTHGMPHVQVGALAGGLALLAVAVPAVGTAVWLTWIVLRGESPNAAIERRRRFWIVIPLAVLSEAGLLWLAASAVRSGNAGLAWSLGGVAVIVLVAAIALVSLFNDDDLELLTELLPVGALIVLAEASFGWLTADFAGEGNLLAAGLLAALTLALLLVALWVLAIGWSSVSYDWEPLVIWALFLVPVAGLVTVAVKLAVDGRSGFALLVGGVAFADLVVTLLVVMEIGPGDVLDVAGELRARAIRLQLSTSQAAPPGGGVSLLARLAGLAVPLGTLAWAVVRVHGTDALTVVSVLAGIAGLSIAAAVLLLVQGVALAWLRPGAPAALIARVAMNTWTAAEAYVAEEEHREASQAGPDEGWRLDRDPVFRELMENNSYFRDRMEMDHGFWEEVAYRSYLRYQMMRDPEFRPRLEYPEFRYRMEHDRYFREESEEEYLRHLRRDPSLRERFERNFSRAVQRDPYLRERSARGYPGGSRGSFGERLGGPLPREPAERGQFEPSADPGPLHLLARPLDPPAAVRANVAVTRDTGLVVDTIWPSMELVLPPTARLDLARQDRKIGSLRLVAASALATTAGWAFLAESVARMAPGGGTLALLLTGPVVVALAAVWLARRMVVGAYVRRGDAVRIYRFDLARAMHLPLPANEAGLLALARTLGGGLRRLDQRLTSYAAESSVVQPDLSGLGDKIAASVSQRTAQEIGELLTRQQAELSRLLGERYEQLRRLLPAGRLEPDDLARLARDIAQRASDPVSAELIRHFAGLQQDFNEQMHGALRTAIEETVLGPPLTNFTGYLMIGLDSLDDEPSLRTADGVITAPPGHRVNLVMSVVRDLRASVVASVIESGPDRPFFIVQPVIIEGGRTSQVADFNAVVDSASLTPLPQRKNMVVRDKAESSFAFQLPTQEGQHEAWFQLYQAGRLIQVVAVRIDTTTAPAVTA